MDDHGLEHHVGHYITSRFKNFPRYDPRDRVFEVMGERGIAMPTISDWRALYAELSA